VLNNLRKEDEVEFGGKRRFLFAQVPMIHFHTVPGHIGQVWPRKVGYNAAVAPQLDAHERQLPSTDIQDIDGMRRSQRSKSLDAFFVTRAIS
jgi:hypothetical protein